MTTGYYYHVILISFTVFMKPNVVPVSAWGGSVCLCVDVHPQWAGTQQPTPTSCQIGDLGLLFIAALIDDANIAWDLSCN